MTVYRMQFHAEREELIEYIAGWVGWHGLSVVAERFFPEYEPVALPQDVPLREAIAELEPVSRVCLSREDLIFGGSLITTEEFMTINRDCHAIALEPVNEHCLRETALATLTSDPETLDFWLQRVLELDEVMHQGAVLMDPQSDTTLFLPSHRHTPGAHELAVRGVPMLACAGPGYFEFADVHMHGDKVAC
jgi:hypothetical protein